MDPLTRKKISRTALRNHAKKLQGDIDALLLNFPDDGARRLRTLKTNFEAQVTKINTSCDEIAALIDVEAVLTKEIEDSLLENDIYFETLVKVDEKLAEFPDEKLVNQKKVPEVRGATASVKEVKLPKIELKSFDGDILNWQSFWDQFESTVQVFTFRN